MANFTSVLSDHIRRLARREVKAITKATRKATSQYRKDIAALKRHIADLSKRLGLSEKKAATVAVAELPAEEADKMRFRADGLKTHRAKLKLSAKAYGQLVGVSALTIYNWETGKSKPRKQQLAKLVAVRKLGKREITKLLGE